MDRLPTEMIENIVLNLDVKLAPFATISKKWCDIIEVRTFQSLYIGNEEDWTKLVDFISRGERKRRVKQIHLEILELPLGNGEDHWRGVATQIKQLYDELKAWGDDLAVNTITIFPPTHPSVDDDMGENELMRLGVPYVDLTEYFPQDYGIPVLSTIRSLKLSGYSHRISTVFSLKLAEACPNLVSWSISGDEMERKDAELVLRSRKSNGSTKINHISALREVEIDLEFINREDQRTTPNNYTIDGLDVFSAWVRHLSTNLTILRLTASHLSAELFWPQSDQNVTELPFWPNLVEFTVSTNIECAQAEYMLCAVNKDHPYNPAWDLTVDIELDTTRPELQLGDSRSYGHLIRPCHRLFDDLCWAMARAMTRMPKLRKVLYKTNEIDIASNGESSNFRFCCYHDGIGDDAITRIEWVFACNKAQLLGWGIPEGALELLRRRWGKKISIGYITAEIEAKIRNGRDWVRDVGSKEEKG